MNSGLRKFFIGIFLGSIIFYPQNAYLATVNATIKISICGNNILEGGEECDNLDFGRATCQNHGFSSGFLVCLPDCSLDTDGCIRQSPSGGGGSNTAGPSITPPTSISLSGRAYPLSTVTLLRDSQVAVKTISGPDAKFKIILSDLSPGNYIFSLYSEDKKGNKSSLFTFPVFLTQGTMAQISGVFIAPTIDIDKKEMKKGDTITLFGQSSPESEINIEVHSGAEKFFKVNSDKDGGYLYNLNTADFEFGEHTAKAKSSLSGEVSPYSQAIVFAILEKGKIIEKEDAIVKDLARAEKCEGKIKADVNCDGKVDLVDFSILAFWYERTGAPDYLDINGSGKIDLPDFSIMAYWWTG